MRGKATELWRQRAGKTEFILGRGFSAGLPQFGKKRPHKIYLGAANGAHKIVHKDKSLFPEIKYSKTSLTTRLI